MFLGAAATIAQAGALMTLSIGIRDIVSPSYRVESMELISLRDAPAEFKVSLLRELGYSTDGTLVLKSDGTPLSDRYTGAHIRIDNMVILPGSEIVLQDDPVSLASYFEEFGDIL